MKGFKKLAFGDECLKYGITPINVNYPTFCPFTRLMSIASSIPRYDCESQCRAPPEFFSGAPWVSIPSNQTLELNPGEYL